MAEQDLKQARRDRMERVRSALEKHQIAGVLCMRSSNVLMLTGYRPVLGMSAAAVNRDGGLLLVVPEDELELARRSWVEDIRTYQPISLSEAVGPVESIKTPLGKVLHELKLHCAELGYEFEADSEPAAYASLFSFQGSIVNILRDVVPTAPLRPADKMLGELRAVKTAFEVAAIRRACAVAGEAFASGRESLAEGQTEIDAASVFRAAFGFAGLQSDEVLTADGFAWCMSGPNAAKAAAIANSTMRHLRGREPIMVQGNSHVNGYWTDITRTYVLGELESSLRQVYDAVFAARAAALAAIRPGARAADVDQAARDVLNSRGFGDKLPHSLGHELGFGTFAADAHPLLHPKSEDVLVPGMTFNVKPAIYLEGELGVRHSDVVAVTESGMELLTPFDVTLRELLVNPVESLRAV